MARTDFKFIKELILNHYQELHNQAATHLKGMDALGITVSAEKCGKIRYFHIYYDDVQASYQRRRFYDTIFELSDELSDLVGKNLRKNSNLSKFRAWFELNIENTRNNTEISVVDKEDKPNKLQQLIRTLIGFKPKEDVIKKHADLFGHFCIMTYKKMNVTEVLTVYKHRDVIEKFFRNIKWYDDCNTPSVHTDEAFDAKMHLVFLTSIINTRLMHISREIKKETKNKRVFTLPGMVDLLEGIECTANPDGIYKRRYAITAKQRLILVKANLSDVAIDEEIRQFNLRQGRIK